MFTHIKKMKKKHFFEKYSIMTNSLLLSSKIKCNIKCITLQPKCIFKIHILQ